MDIVTLDFETYFDRDYTLKKLTTEAYIRDERFETLGCGIRFADGQRAYGDGPLHVKMLLRQIDWSKTAVIAHHAAFDGFILSHHYGIEPAFWFDTLSMARLLLGNHVSVALGSLAALRGLPAKSVPYDEFMGRRWENLTTEVRKALCAGCLHDVDLTFELWRQMMPEFPKEELKVIDMTIRMFTEPKLVGDRQHFEWIKDKEWTCKNEMLIELGVTEKQLGSNEQFKKLLEAEGIETEYKEGKNGPIPAYAKSDDFMKRLEDDPNERVRSLVEAKLAVRSTIDETRAGRFASMASRGPLPVYLNYCGADTLRWSGGDSVNYQNFGRKSELRKGLCAPEGYLLGVYDKSQIECRFLNMMARQTDVIERFRNGDDPYIPLASKIYGEPIDPADKARRGVGKQGELMCGYGAGWRRFQGVAKGGGYGPPVSLSDQDSERAVDIYRDTHPGVIELWQEGNWVIKLLSKGETRMWRDLVEIKNGKIILPNGAKMTYTVRWDPDHQKPGSDRRGSWLRRTRYGWKPIWGATIVQNCMEALARVDLSQGFIRLWRQGIKVVGTVHDEGWFLHPKGEAEARHAVCIEELSRSPTWLPGLPVEVEGHLGERYEK